MTRFVSTRHFSLDFLGDEWKDCFIVMSSLTVKEVRELISANLRSKDASAISEASTNMLMTHFVSGTAYDFESKTIVKLKPEDIENLPSQVLEKAVLFLVGGST